MKKMECILPEDSSFQIYHGYIRIHDHEFRIRMSNPSIRYDNIIPFFQCDDNLFELLQENISLVHRRLIESQDISEFIQELIIILSRCLKNHSTKIKQIINQKKIPNVKFYEKFIKEMDQVGWDKLCFLDDTLSLIHLCIITNKKRKHIMQFILPTDYPTSPPQYVVDLPIPFEETNQRQKQVSSSTLQATTTTTIVSLVDKFIQTLEKCQDFFTVMDDLDSHCWVIDPLPPSSPDQFISRAITTRRIVVERHCSILLDISPLRPYAVCECRFIGVDSTASCLQQRLSTNIQKWNTSIFPRENLEKIVQIIFPIKSESIKNGIDFNLECGICYSYFLDDNNIIPECTCNNTHCGKSFHQECLFEWLKSFPITRIVFNTVFGSCPYCSEPITVSTTAT